ncbi:D-hexose-6-phosphate mutarotase [Phytobacter sp. V91]|uniref:D-hexose-6-phosphate mutarotase n=1 Tax=Phytobacter sp. V91 TaxID=3369425 RepID=UPI003F5E1346
MINTIFALPVVEQITSTLSRRVNDELDVIVVDHPKVKASVALQGAHLLSWKPVGEEEVLWLSANTPFKHGVALRGGVPICWPWFGPAAQPGLPAHGFARNLPWTLKAHNEDDNGVVLTFELQSSDESRKFWAHDFTLLARFKLAKTCEIELEAHGEFETLSALHTYFNVGDISAVKVSGLGDRFIDKVNDAKEDVLTDGVQTFPDRTDRVYLNPEACSVIKDGALNRSIEVIHHHHFNVVGWNPGPALSASMADMPDDGYKTFVCVESACATKTQKTTEEKPSRLAQTIKVSR